jgi:hypothetical protein
MLRNSNSNSNSNSSNAPAFSLNFGLLSENWGHYGKFGLSVVKVIYFNRLNLILLSLLFIVKNLELN